MEGLWSSSLRREHKGGGEKEDSQLFVGVGGCNAKIQTTGSILHGKKHEDDDRHFRLVLLTVTGMLCCRLCSQGLGEATDLVLAGCSAGGLAVYLHVDRWREALAAKAAALGRSASSVNVVGLADSGFFLRGGKPGPSAAGAATDCDYEARMRFLFSELNAAAAVPAACAAAAAPGESYKCMFAEHLLPHVRTPVFTLQSVSDGWQLEWIACNATAGTLDAKLHRSSVLAAIERALGVVDASPSGAGPIHGAFIDGCQHHCHCYNDIVIGNTTQVQAFQRFYIAVTTAEGRRGNGAPYSLGDSAAGAFVWKDLKCGILLSTDGTTECPYKPFSWEF